MVRLKSILGKRCRQPAAPLASSSSIAAGTVPSVPYPAAYPYGSGWARARGGHKGAQGARGQACDG